ncbi:MAG TPA: RidA family protein [Candidatus Limnocylindria bacterium]|nr:RidA family protein [Candidatus Limnocylindria bacterium]
MPVQDPKNPRRYLHSTSTKYEFQFGYSRAVRHGRIVRVAGTAGLDEEGQVVSEDVVDQMRRALAIVKDSLEDLGATLEDVIMTRIYVREVHDIDRIALIHGEVFRDIRPATTIVKVDFIDPRILVEIEAEAVYGGADAKDATG